MCAGFNWVYKFLVVVKVLYLAVINNVVVRNGKSHVILKKFKTEWEQKNLVFNSVINEHKKVENYWSEGDY